MSLGWEWGQLPAYRCPASGLAEVVALLVPAAAGDVALTFVLVLFVVVLQRQPHCPLRLTGRRALVFVVGGAVLAVAIERAALATGLWDYSDLMPRVPGLQVGWLPVLHTMTVPLLSALLACTPLCSCCSLPSRRRWASRQVTRHPPRSASPRPPAGETKAAATAS